MSYVVWIESVNKSLSQKYTFNSMSQKIKEILFDGSVP